MFQNSLKKLLILTAGSAACLASTSRAFALTNYVDMLTESKTCAAAWTWQEYLPATYANEPNNCEMVEQTVVNEDGELQLTISQETEEFVIGTTEKGISIESAVKSTLDQNFHRSLKTYPEITNPQFLTSESRFYSKATTAILYPPEAILAPYGVKTGDGECRRYMLSVGIVVGPPGSTPPPSGPAQCLENYIHVDVFGVYKKLKYTLPTKKIMVKKDQFCSDTKSVEKSPSRSSIGKSEPFATLDQVKDPSYESVDGKSIPGAERFNIVCPHGVSYETPNKQAQYALNWLRVRENNLDLNNQDIQGTIKYLKALALEKTSELSESQLSSILELHKKYPGLAFGGQETDENAVETSPEDVKTNRDLWAQIEKKLVAAPKPAVSLRDLRDKVEAAGSVQIHNGSTSSAYVGKSMNFPEVYYNSSSFGYVTSYIFQEDGSIVASTRGGSVTHSKGSQTHTEIVNKIKESLQSYAADDLATQNLAVKELIGMLVKYLNDEKAAATPKTEQSFQKLATTVGSKYVNLYSGFQSMTTLSYDATQSTVTYSYQNRISARTLVFDAKGRITESWSAGGGAQTFEPGQPKHTEIANQVLADVTNWKLNRTDLTPELIEVYDNLLAYLNNAVK